MEKEPLLPTTIKTRWSKKKKKSTTTSTWSTSSSPLPTSFLSPLPEDSVAFSPPISTPPTPSFLDALLLPPTAAAPTNYSSDDDPSPISAQSPHPPKTKTNLHRSRTAPAMSALNDFAPSHKDPTFGDSASSSGRRLVLHALIFLSLYLTSGVVVYTLCRAQFSSNETHPVVDALYFSIVTMCTIGYGDITPSTTLSKLFSIAFVLVGFGFIDILLSGMVSYVLDLQETILLGAVRAAKAGGKRDAGSYIVDIKKGRMRIRMKVGLALGVVLLCVGVGTGVLHFVEHLDLLDSFYLSVMSVTTVGYGDRAFKTLAGRMFASVWLLVSTLAVARAFLYLAEARIDKRHRRIAKWVLGRDMTVSEFLAADIDNNGFVTKSEFVVYKLKEMGKITEKDISQICNQFNKLDAGNCGKITLTDLIESHH